jgi:hypothetical protein
VAGRSAGHGSLVRVVRGKKWSAHERWRGALAEQSTGLGAHDSNREQGESSLARCMTLSPPSPSLFSVSASRGHVG